jgi:hypothetical protein
MHGLGGTEVAQKTMTVHKFGPQGTWSLATLVSTGPAVEARTFTRHTDSGSNIQMVFGGADTNGIFSGAFNQNLSPSPGAVGWGPNFNNTFIAPEATRPTNLIQTISGYPYSGRTMSAVDCGGNVYMTVFNDILMRVDSVANPPTPAYWVLYAQDNDYRNWASAVSGFRGLSCVADPNDNHYELWTALENGDLYTIPLGKNPPPYNTPYTITSSDIELHLKNYLSSAMGVILNQAVAAYNRTIIYPNTGSWPHNDIIMGVGTLVLGGPPGNQPPGSPANWSGPICTSWNDPNDKRYTICQHSLWLLRHSNGSYDMGVIAPFAYPWELSARDVVVGTFSSGCTGGPKHNAACVFAGGYEPHNQSPNNTAWVYDAAQ